MQEKIISTETLYEGRIVKLELHDVELPNGQRSKREVVRHSGAVAIVALDREGLVLMVRQYRLPAAQILLEIPAGTLNINEDPLTAAGRELQEETGYKPGRLEPMGGLYVAPGYTTEYIHLFLATDLQEAPLAQDEDEFVEMTRYSMKEVLALIDSGHIVDGKTISGVLRAARKLGL